MYILQFARVQFVNRAGFSTLDRCSVGPLICKIGKAVAPIPSRRTLAPRATVLCLGDSLIMVQTRRRRCSCISGGLSLLGRGP